jgi:hypothetical protein
MALRIALVVALAVWLLATGLAFLLPDVPRQTAWLAMLLLTSFALFCVYWLPMEISVDETWITYHGITGLRRLRLADIESINVLPVPGMTNYDVCTAASGIVFTSFISGHRDLVELLVSRARLVPRMA